MNGGTRGAGLTRALVERALAADVAQAPPAVATLVEQCVLDFVAVTIAGARESCVLMLKDILAAQNGARQASVFGHALRLPAADAAQLNGTSAHALDYDDVNFALLGHPTVPVLPALFALAETRRCTGRQLMNAFLAGYETECRVGLLVAPSHYERGFHATATIGTLGAAVACAHLLQLDARATAHALGIAAIHSAGLKSLFGTSCKPLHAGNAARHGLLAATLAARGFDSREDILECPQGFAATLADDFHPEAALAAPPGGYHLLANLFKYHASCYETHATIECGRKLAAEHRIAPSSIRRVVVRVNPHSDRICNIQAPVTGLEMKFSLRMTAAMALAGVETGQISAFDDSHARDSGLHALRERVTIEFDPAIRPSVAEMSVEFDGGHIVGARHDAGRPLTDLARQGERLTKKFRQLVAPHFGAERTASLHERIGHLAELPYASRIVTQARGDS